MQCLVFLTKQMPHTGMIYSSTGEMRRMKRHLQIVSHQKQFKGFKGLPKTGPLNTPSGKGLKPASHVQSSGEHMHTGSCWASNHLPLLQVLHVRALEGSFQEVGQFIVNRQAAFQVS